MSGFFVLPRHGEAHDNPFRATAPNSRGERVKIFFFTVSLVAPLRFIFIVLVLVICGVVANLVLLGSQRDQPFGSFRRLAALPVRFGFRMLLFFAGYHWIEVKGRADPCARVWICNHVSLFDSFYFVFRYGIAPAAMTNVVNMPVVGALFRYGIAPAAMTNVVNMPVV